MPDMGAVVAITFWFVLLASVISFIALAMGLLTLVTGRSYAPPGWRRLRLHEPASRRAHRLRHRCGVHVRVAVGRTASAVPGRRRIRHRGNRRGQVHRRAEGSATR